MNTKLSLAIVLLIFALIDAKGGRSGEKRRHRHGGHSGGRGSHSRGGGSGSRERHEHEGENYSWGINVKGKPVQQEADTPVNKKVILIKSDGLRSLKIARSLTVFDFSGNDPLAVIGIRGRGCYVISFSKSFDDVKKELEEYNNTDIDVKSSTRLQVSGVTLSRPETREFVAAHPALKKVCRPRIIYHTEVTTENSVDGETRITVLSEDREIELIVPDQHTTAPTPPLTRRHPAGPPFTVGRSL